MRTFARHSFTTHSLLILTAFIFAVVLLYLVPVLFLNSERIYSSELGYAAFSPNGEDGGGIIPASCESNPVVAHSIPIYSNTETPYITGYYTESLAGCPGVTPAPLPGRIQGIQCMTGPVVARPGTVTLNGETQTGNPYGFNNLTPGNYTVSFTPPANHTLRGYTVCSANQTDCHTGTPIPGSSATVSVPSDGFVDLWWHCTPPAPTVNLVGTYGNLLNSDGPFYIPYADSFFLGWTSENADSCVVTSPAGIWNAKNSPEAYGSVGGYGPQVTLTQSTLFQISCDNSVSDARDSLQVNVCTQGQKLINGACQTCLAPIINGPTKIGGVTNQSLQQQYTATYVNPTLITQTGTRPPGVNFNVNTGLFSGTPSSPGLYTMTLGATGNTCGDTTSKTVTVRICPVGNSYDSVNDTCTTNQIDQCPNIADMQATVPIGLVKDSVNGNCVNACFDGSTPANGVCPIQVDQCPNISGAQSTVPTGLVKDSVNGNCVQACQNGTPPSNGSCSTSTTPPPSTVPPPPPPAPPQTPSEPTFTPQCSDGVDNDDPEDTLADRRDPGCHTDGDPNNSASYRPADNDERHTPRGVDLIAFAPTLQSGLLNPGATLVFGGSVRNVGNESTSVTFRNLFQIDVGNNGNGEFDINMQKPSTAAPNGSYPTLTGISIGQTKTFISPLWVNVPAGTHAIRLCTDLPGSAVGETNENNNCGPSFVFTVGTPPTQCSDGIDNADPEDTIADYPNDPGCSSPSDNDETNTPDVPPVDLCPSVDGTQTVLPCPGGGVGENPPGGGAGGDGGVGGGGSCVPGEGLSCSSAPNSCGMTDGIRACDGRCIPPPDSWCSVDIEFIPGEEETRASETIRRGGNCTIEWRANNVRQCTISGPTSFYCPSTGRVGQSCQFSAPGESRVVVGGITISNLLQTTQFNLDCRNNSQSFETKVFACRINPTFIEI